MMRNAILPRAVLLATLVCAPALADEPGGGVTKPQPMVTGEQVYVQVCASCHMIDGKGGVGAGAIPSLAANPRLAAPVYPIVKITKGAGAMPWFNDTLTPAQIAGVVTYIRTNFGNAYAKPVAEAEVTPFMGAAPVNSH